MMNDDAQRGGGGLKQDYFQRWQKHILYTCEAFAVALGNQTTGMERSPASRLSENHVLADFLWFNVSPGCSDVYRCVSTA